jgi:stage IV sporulation protein FB
VLLAEPQRTPYDLNFQVLGFPVRIHPLFWVAGFVLGFRGGPSGPDPIAILTWMLVLFVSILIHELGHAILMRRFGRPAHIVLYLMGGLAVEGEDSPYSAWSSHASSSFGRRSRTPGEQILISFAGPAAGFIFAAFVVVGVLATGGEVRLTTIARFIPWVDATLGGALADNRPLQMLVDYLLFINIFWGLVNLLPVFPLDGGQIAQQMLIVSDPWSGTIRALWLSVIVAGIAAIVGGVMLKSMFMALMFASLGISNYLTLQQMGGGGGRRPW